MIPIENKYQVNIFIICSLSIVIATVPVILRLIAKNISKRLDYSDYCIIVALLWNTALQTCCMLLVTHGGFGFHTTDVFARFGVETVTFFFKGIMTFSILWNFTVCFSKLSVLLMYTALIPHASMQKWARGIGATVILWNFCNIVAAFLICRPIARNWDLTRPGTCGSQPSFYFSMGFINLVTDAVVIVLPMPYLYRLNLAWRRKLLAMALLSIGIGTWAITIYRQMLLPSLDFTDMTHAGVAATILSGLEPAVAIALACIPLLRPLFPASPPSPSSVSRYKFGTSKRGSVFSSKKGSAHDPTATFSELVDDEDAGSQIQLRPVEGVQSVLVEGNEERGRLERGKDGVMISGHSITVERKWEVSRN